MSALVTTWSGVTGAPASARVPNAGKLSIFTLASVAPVSASAKPKSSALKVYVVSEPIVTVLSAAVGAVLTRVATWKTGERARMLYESEGSPVTAS